jgi:hypothetical protein
MDILCAFSFALFLVSHLAAIVVLHDPRFGEFFHCARTGSGKFVTPFRTIFHSRSNAEESDSVIMPKQLCRTLDQRCVNYFTQHPDPCC